MNRTERNRAAQTMNMVNTENPSMPTLPATVTNAPWSCTLCHCGMADSPAANATAAVKGP